MLKANIENRTVGAAMLLDNHNIQTIGTALVINGKNTQPVAIGGGGGGVTMGPTGSAIEEIKLYTGTLPNGNPTDTYFLREIILPGQESWGYEWTIISCEIKHGYWLGPGSVGPIAFRYCYVSLPAHASCFRGSDEIILEPKLVS